jgi:hypothetical protein
VGLTELLNAIETSIITSNVKFYMILIKPKENITKKLFVKKVFFSALGQSQM